MEKKILNISILISVICLLSAGFFFGRFVERKLHNRYCSSEIQIDTVYVKIPKIIPKIKTVFLKPDENQIPNSDSTNTNNVPSSYEIATIDTTFQFPNKSSHELQISYNEMNNFFEMTSTYRYVKENPVKPASSIDQAKKRLISTVLTTSYAFGESENQIGLGIGLKYKSLCISPIAYSNKMAGCLVSIEF